MRPLFGCMLQLYRFNLEESSKSIHFITNVFGAQEGLTEELLKQISSLDFNLLIPTEDKFVSNHSHSLIKYFEGMMKDIRETKEQQKNESLDRNESGEVCPICYSYMMDRIFEPCGHKSCHRCIERHLLNSEKCFFCNAKITSLKEIGN